MTLQNVMTEVQEKLADFQNEGVQQDQLRDKLYGMLKHDYDQMEMIQIMEIMFDPNVGFQFAYRVNETIGAVNEVIVKQYELEPFHIKEFDLATVKTIEEVTGDDIDTVFEKMEEMIREHEEGNSDE